MEEKKIVLEDLFKKLRKLADEYETEEFDSETFIFKNGSEEKMFSRDLLEIVTDYLKSELNFDISEMEDEEKFEEIAMEDDLVTSYLDADDDEDEENEY